MGQQAVDFTGFGHGMPLIADAASGEDEWKFRAGFFTRIVHLLRQIELGFVVFGKKTKITEQTTGARMITGGHGPLKSPFSLQALVAEA